MSNYVSIGKICEELGISLSTAYRWIKSGKIKEAFRTIGTHRRFDLEEIREKFFPNYQKLEHKKEEEIKVATYARVSSHDQSDDLIRQANRLKLYCIEKKYSTVEHISDLGSGLNYKKPGLKKLFQLILNKEINILIINHKDRLLRFGSEIIFNLCEFFNVKVIILENEEKNFEEELVSNVIELMTVFCAKMYGKRSHKNKNKIKDVNIQELIELCSPNSLESNQKNIEFHNEIQLV